VFELHLRRDAHELKELDVYVGRKLRERRQKLDLTLIQVADRLGVSHQQIQKYEQAISRISAPALYQFAYLYGVDPQYFFEGYESYARKKIPFRCFDEHKDLNILLVENDPAFELSVRRAIEACELPTKIFCVHDGLQALEFLRNRNSMVDFPRPDIILLDWDSPKKDGLSVLRDIKRDRLILDIPVIIIVDNVSSLGAKSAYSSQAAGYISKVSCFDVLEKKVCCLINYWSNVVVLPFHKAQIDEELNNIETFA
jgi:chemotaxis family two-component system response regulator Rcp1